MMVWVVTPSEFKTGPSADPVAPCGMSAVGPSADPVTLDGMSVV